MKTQLITQKNDLKLDLLKSVGRLYANAALDLGYSVILLPGMYNSLLVRQSPTSEKYVLVYGSHIGINSAAGTQLANDKSLCNIFLQSTDFPATIGVPILRTEFDEKIQGLRLPPFPVVVKPNANTVKGQGVTTNVTNKKDLHAIAKQLLIQYPEIIIEEFVVRKKEFRVLVLDGTIIGIVERIPAYIVGDGKQTIRQLIKEKNILRKQQKAGLISLDQELHHNLRTRNISLSSVPKKGIHVQLKNVCNFGAGGETKIVSLNGIQPSLKKMMKNLSHLTGLRLVGVDILTDSLSTVRDVKKMKIIELNPNPDIAMHGFKDPKTAEKIAQKIMRAIFY